MFQAQRPFGFGTTTTTTPAFGATAFGTTPTPAFGAAATPAFGASTPAFGAPSATPAFGATTPAFGSTTPAFGATATPAFGATPSAFGATTPTMTPFGGASATPFGGASATPTPSAFGTTTTPTTFGGFGSTPSSTFGATPAPSAFGTPSTTTGFGGATTTSFAFGGGGTGFGATAPASSPFGAAASTFSSPFGAAPATTATPAATPSTTGSLFGGTSTTFGFGQTPSVATNTGTGNPKFQVTQESDPNGTVSHQSITAMAAYNKKSFEELRWEDYQAGKKNSASPALSATSTSATPFASPFGTTTTTTTTAPTTTGTGFGFPPATTTTTPLFGTTATPATTTPTPTFGGFGTTTTPATTSPFGTPATTSTFPSFSASLTAAPATSTATTTNPFGGFAPAASTASPFGATTASPFGTTTPSFTSPFATPATSASAATTTTPAFGSTASTANPFATAPSTSLFNPTPTTTTTNPFSSATFSVAPTTTTPATTSLFNPSTSTIPTPLFSTPVATTATTNPFSFPSTSQSFLPSAQIGLGTQPPFATPATSISSPPVGAPLPMFNVPTSTATNSLPQPSAPTATPIPSLSFTPRTPTPQKHSYVSSHPRSLPRTAGSLVRVKDSPSYSSGRLFSEDKGFSPSGIHITPESLSLRTSTPSKPRIDIKKLNLPPFEDKQPAQPPKALLESTTEPAYSSQLLTPTHPHPFTMQITPARSRAEANEVPTLRNPNYYTKPSMEQLREMGPAELARVEDFVLGCVDLGFVRWHGKTDIRGLNLDDIVTFEKKAVTVYPEQGIYPKPPVGEGLNKPATITLLHVFPKKQETADKYAQMIANTTKKFDGKLLGYDPEKGVWEFEVKHFSRYGLADDDDEPDTRDAVTAPQSAAPLSQLEHADTKVPPPKTLVSTPDIPPVSTSTLQMSVYAPPDPRKSNRTTRLSGLSTRGLLFTEEPAPLQQPLISSHKGKAVSGVPPFSQSFLTKEHERTEQVKVDLAPQFNKTVQVQSPAPIFTSLPQAEMEDVLVVHTPLLRLKKLALNESVISQAPPRAIAQSDVSLTMGRSFRVGWGPNGRLLRISSTLGEVSVSRPALSTITTTPFIAPSTDALVPSSPTNIDRYLLELLQTHLSHSTAQHGPHFTLKDLHANIQANIRICDTANENSTLKSEAEDYRQHLYLIWTLVYSLWGKMPDGAFPLEIAKQLPSDVNVDSDVNGRSISVHLMRKLLVSKWLTQALQVPVEDSVKAVKVSSGNNALAILHYLTGRQISPAVALAQRSHDYRLAILLTQTWSSALQLLGVQIEQWELANALPFIDKHLLAVYKLLAGDVDHVGKNIQMIKDDWLRCFALHFWYKHVPSTPMPEVLSTYDGSVMQGSASAAIPAYSKNRNSTYTTAKDSLYRLLQLYAATTHHQVLEEAQSGPVITALRFAPSTSSLPTTLLLSTINPANQTQDHMDFSLAWHLYTVLRSVPALSSVVDLPVPHQLHTSYAAQLEILGHWQWAIYVLLHINFDSHKTVNGEWDFASGRQEAISSILERHAPHISDVYYQFLTQDLQVPASWVDVAVGHYLIYDRQYLPGLQRLLCAGEWNEAHRTILEHLVPLVIAPMSSASNTNTITEHDLLNLLEALHPNYTHLIDPTWSMGGHIYLAYLKLKQKLGSLSGDSSQFQALLIKEISNIYTLCELVAQWSQLHMSSTQATHTKIGITSIATYLGHALLILAQSHHDTNLPYQLHTLPLPPDVRAYIMEDYFHTIVYAV